MRHQERQQTVFRRAEADRAAVRQHPMPGLVERQAVARHPFLGPCGGAAAQHGLDARQQLARREGLGDVVIRAALEAGDLVGLLRARGQHDDRDVARILVAPQLPGQLQPAGVRQHPVEQDEVRPPVADARPRRLAVLGQCDLQAGAPQPESNEVANGLLVLDDQDPGFGHVQPGSVPGHC